MKTAYIGIGSNLGDRHQNCLTALDLLQKAPGCKLTGHSDWYWTEPVGVKDQERYVNGVASISTGLSARDLLKMLLIIEQDMGRVRRKRWESRLIDLDLLLYGRELINEKHLTIPHPLMHERRFVLVPLVQLEPNLIHPSLGLTMSELLAHLPEDGQEVGLIEE
ncbi:MAG: 2-amino-4-hydroxy-6-hydroxymethyldihydropteridine diphosphokinase [Deltaproteobacteria bacterium]|nr:2-amino-4-hydroxy-6-hydroxymethyldihydropteridine diphosphokinase [Deltaproteobacteria bacterium]